MHRDTVIGIVGVVILVAAMVGVFTYERGQAANLIDDAVLTLANSTLPALEGNVALGATADETVTLNQTGITNVTFTLRWTPGAGVDTLRLNVAPSNATGLATGASSEAENDGEITLTVPVNNTARDGVLGVGAWQISVEFVSAEVTTPIVAPPTQPPVAPPGTTDSEVDYTVGTNVQGWVVPDGDDS